MVTKIVQPTSNQPTPNQSILSSGNNRLQLAPDQQPGHLHQSLLSRSGNQTALPLASPHSGTKTLTSAAHPTSKPLLSEKKQGDAVPEKSSEVPHFGADVADVNEPATCKEAADSTELKVPNSENDLKSSDGDGKLLSEIGDKSGQSEYAVKKISKLIEQDGDSTINQMMKEEASEKLEPDVKEDGTSLHEDKKVQDGEPQKNLLSQPADILEGQNVKKQDTAETQNSGPLSDASGIVQSQPMADKGSRGQALGSVPERTNMHAAQSQNVFPTKRFLIQVIMTEI